MCKICPGGHGSLSAQDTFFKTILIEKGILIGDSAFMDKLNCTKNVSDLENSVLRILTVSLESIIYFLQMKGCFDHVS